MQTLTGWRRLVFGVTATRTAVVLGVVLALPFCATGFFMDDYLHLALLDELHHSDVDQYVRTMHRLRELPVRVVHAGHEGSFGRERLKALAEDYLRAKGAL